MIRARTLNLNGYLNSIALSLRFVKIVRLMVDRVACPCEGAAC